MNFAEVWENVEVASASLPDDFAVQMRSSILYNQKVNARRKVVARLIFSVPAVAQQFGGRFSDFEIGDAFSR